MVISDQHRFVFVNLPQTASTAISRELVDQYGAREFCFKHALWRTNYLRAANAGQKKYRVISGLRNPMDITVSTYFKVRSDHEQRYSHAEANKIKHGFLRKHIMYWWNKRSHAEIVGKNLGFNEWFLRNHKVPYASWAILDHHRFDKVIRYENLQEDFSEALRILQVEQTRPLPVGNKTAKEGRHFTDYFDTDRAKRHAKYVFGPYMRQFGYSFPPEWDHIREPWTAQPMYTLVNVARKIFWLYLR
ncbi:MAG TPA: sulfotransferase family 2 domain-containing protein [Flavobacteriales bacterium]|nr:sulfotransferase family 2 domain-containing protein [Flavobacteriales bacterium]